MSCTCGCCDGVKTATPETTANRPGLDRLRYRVGTHATFLESMIAALTLSRDPALDGLTTRAAADASIALLDGWATIADVLTFYQERIANEGYLRTATERRSILELARLVGYELRPGVAASLYLAYTLDKDAEVEIPAGARAQSLPGPGELPQSFETSLPLKARYDWNNLEARKTRPLIVVPEGAATVADRTYDARTVNTLYLAGTNANLKPNDRVLLQFNPAEPHARVVLSAEAQAAEGRTTVVLQPSDLDDLKNEGRSKKDEKVEPAVLDVVIGDLKKAPAKREESAAHVDRQVRDTFAPTADAGPSLLIAANPALKETFYKAWANARLAPESELVSVDALRVKAPVFGHNAPLKPIINARGVIEGSEEWPLADSLVVTLDFSLPGAQDVRKISAGSVLEVTLRRGSEAGTVRLNVAGAERMAEGDGFAVALSRPNEEGFELAVVVAQAGAGANRFGLERPMRFLFGPATDANDDRSAFSVRLQVEEGDAPDQTLRVRSGQSGGYQAGARRVTMNVASDAITVSRESRSALSTDGEAGKIITLDATYDQIVPGSWVLIERLDVAGKRLPPFLSLVEHTATLSKTAFGMTGKVTQLTLEKPWLDNDWLGGYKNTLAAFRNTTVYAQNDPQKLVDEPIGDNVGNGAIELQTLYNGLESGRWLIVTGERADIAGTAGVMGQELVMLARMEQDVERAKIGGKVSDLPGSRARSTLLLTDPLAYTYKRDTVRIYANVVKATHGETRQEVLGSGDGSKAFQQFTLKQPPLTYVPATNPSGVESTLDVRVNEVSWHRVDQLVDAGPADRRFTTETDDAGRTTVIFGDGTHGARLPTGLQNVTSVYRNGLGKGGNVKREQVSLLVTRPLGVKEVINPIAASGGADAESRDDARDNVPLTLLALDRLVSVPDYEAFARSFAGIGKAKAERLSDGRRDLVHITIAGADDIPVDTNSDLYRHLTLGLREFGDPQQPLAVKSRELLFLVISASVGLMPDYHWTDVERRLRAALLDAFSFKRRQLGQDVVLSEVLSVMHGVDGVAFVDVDVLDAVSELTPIDVLKDLGGKLKLEPRIDVKFAGENPARCAQLAILTPEVPDTLILRGPEK